MKNLSQILPVFSRCQSFRPGRESGATIVEFAIAIPLFIFLVVAAIEVGRYQWVRAMADASAHRALSVLTKAPNTAADPNVVSNNAGPQVNSDVQGRVQAYADQFASTGPMGALASASSTKVSGVGVRYPDGYYANPSNLAEGYKPGLTMTEIRAMLESEPVSVEVQVQYDPIFPWMPTTVQGMATGFVELPTDPSQPSPTDCNGQPYGTAAYGTIACPCVFQNGNNACGAINCGANNISCPCEELSGFTASGNTCICQAGHTAYELSNGSYNCCPDGSAGACGAGTVFNPATCGCSCVEGTAPVGPLPVTECACTDSLKTLDGDVCVCATPMSDCGTDGSYNTDTCVCDCPTVAGSQYGKDTDGKCVCELADDADCGVGGSIAADCTCECDAVENSVKGSSGLCECKGGFTQNSAGDSCECTRECGAGTASVIAGACGCDCADPNVPKLPDGSCTCGADFSFDGSSCICDLPADFDCGPGGAINLDPLSSNYCACECDPAVGTSLVNGKCECADGLKDWDGDSCECKITSADCGYGATTINSTTCMCDCPAPSVLNAVTGTCSCPAPYISNGTTCDCPLTDAGACGPGGVAIGGGTCGCTCGANTLNSGDQLAACQCKDARFEDADNDGQCECALTAADCAPGTLNTTTCKCECSGDAKNQGATIGGVAVNCECKAQFNEVNAGTESAECLCDQNKLSCPLEKKDLDSCECTGCSTGKTLTADKLSCTCDLGNGFVQAGANCGCEGVKNCGAGEADTDGEQCQCDCFSGATQSSATGVCSCPADFQANGSAEACECKTSVLSCGPGTQNTTTCNCTCSGEGMVLSNSNNTCSCAAGYTSNGPGLGCSCDITECGPGVLSGCGCSCTGPHEQNVVLGGKVVDCTCVNPFTDDGNGNCVCDKTCNNGFVLNESTCQCDCPNTTVAGYCLPSYCSEIVNASNAASCDFGASFDKCECSSEG